MPSKCSDTEVTAERVVTRFARGRPIRLWQPRREGARNEADDIIHAVKEATAGKGIDVYYETQPPVDFAPTVEMMAPRGRIIVMAGRNAKPVLPNGAVYVKGLQLLGFAMFNCTPQEQR
ncbi:MAG: zinc-binding dehydrogenase, partial [Chloroflexota bacterium]